MASAEQEKGYIEKGTGYVAVVGFFVALVGTITHEVELVGLGIAALVGGLLGKSLLSSKPQSA